jgi:hypothetical protein
MEVPGFMRGGHIRACVLAEWGLWYTNSPCEGMEFRRGLLASLTGLFSLLSLSLACPADGVHWVQGEVISC